MASDDNVSDREKLRRLGDWLRWLEREAAKSDAPFVLPISARIGKMYRVLDGWIPEDKGRDNICSTLSAVAQMDLSTSKVRAALKASVSGHEHRLRGDVSRISDRTIERTVAAWARKRGVKAKGEPDKWTLTAELLREGGFGLVHPDTLRDAWNRLRK